MTSFEVGKSYETRSLVDHTWTVRITVTSRTAKTIKTVCGKVLRISNQGGIESVKPLGSYSMAPIIKADAEK